jgi:hypothetical protein
VETILAGIVLLLLVGAFFGNLYASRRRRPARSRFSIYDLILRRLEAERGPARTEEA